jgi:putative transcriptional regulator
MDVFGKKLNHKNEVQIGNLLLAEPMLADSNFQRTVILVCEHIKEEGSFGLVINK